MVIILGCAMTKAVLGILGFYGVIVAAAVSGWVMSTNGVSFGAAILYSIGGASIVLVVAGMVVVVKASEDTAGE